MKFRPPIGESDFRKIREQGLGYIDKTDFIREVLDDSSAVLLFPRPRRFGKTLNVSTLGYFLRKSEQDVSHLFNGLAVTNDAAAMAHFQKYPVVSVTFKEVKAKTFDEMLGGVAKQIERVCREHAHILEGKPVRTGRDHRLERMLSGTATKSDLETSLLDLMEVLHEHYEQEVVVLIDEYDTPIQAGYLNGYFDDVVLFFRNFLSAALKDNVHLFKAVLTGILRVSKENMFSGLNNIDVHSILSLQYATHFGFTENEVATMIDPAHLDDVRAWYNGYLFGGQVIYNPWSILSYMKRETLETYWVNTGSTDIIERLATKQGMGLSAKSAALLNGETIEIEIDDNIVLRDIERNPDALWNFLLFSGYLKLASFTGPSWRLKGSLCIPNKEVHTVYENMFRHWLRAAVPNGSLVNELVTALLGGKADDAEKLVQQILLMAISYQDPGGREPEKLYHGLILGLLIHLEGEYEVRSNRESGYGRADVLMRPKTTGRPGVVIELKVLDDHKTADTVLTEAAKQVRDRQYATELRNGGASPVFEYAMVFDGKRAWVKKVDDLLAAAAAKNA